MEHKASCEVIDIPAIPPLFDHPGDNGQPCSQPGDGAASGDLLDLAEGDIYFVRQSFHISLPLCSSPLFCTEDGQHVIVERSILVAVDDCLSLISKLH